MDTEIPKFTKKEFKQIKYFVYFALFIVVFQAFQYVITKRTTEKYKELFSKITDLIILTNSVSNENSTIHRSLLNITFSSDSNDVKIFQEKLRVSQQKIQNEISIIGKKINEYELYSFDKTKLFIQIKFAEQQYKKNYTVYLSELKSMSKDEALLYRKNKMRPLLESFQKTHYLFLIRIFTDQQILIEEIADDAEETSFRLLIIGNFLLVIIILFLVYIIFTERKKLV